MIKFPITSLELLVNQISIEKYKIYEFCIERYNHLDIKEKELEECICKTTWLGAFLYDFNALYNTITSIILVDLLTLKVIGSNYVLDRDKYSRDGFYAGYITYESNSDYIDRYLSISNFLGSYEYVFRDVPIKQYTYKELLSVLICKVTLLDRLITLQDSDDNLDSPIINREMEVLNKIKEGLYKDIEELNIVRMSNVWKGRI